MAGSSTFAWAHALRLDSNKSPFSSPIALTHKAFADVKPVSWQRYNVAGILVTVYGQEELPQHPDEIVACWLMHGRGDTQDSMAYTAAALLDAWNSKRKNHSQKGLICVCFDQRNHGSRMVDNLANISWKQGNPTHGPDMFNLYVATAHDLSLLITQLPMYLPFKIHDHICGGVSLGGHATWVALMSEPRISAGMVVIGCPDYVRLMTDRAIRSKVPSAISSDPPGQDFLGSSYFPQSLLGAIEQYDPAGMLMGELDVVTGEDHLHTPSEREVKALRPVLERTLAGKKIICLSGGKDKLVPHAQGKVFLDWLRRGIKEGGWAADQGIKLEDILDPGAGHEFSALMRKEAQRWICDLLSDEDRISNRASKL
ncbi:putative alpha/beta hydrolase-1 [Septoria linicola]|nr:putative alpha/beta hydrolase-1 [Septoria linicola]